jgi:hypothetical protein
MFLPFESAFTFCISSDALFFIVLKLHFEFRRETPCRKRALFTSVPEHRRNPLRAQFTSEDEIRN